MAFKVSSPSVESSFPLERRRVLAALSGAGLLAAFFGGDAVAARAARILFVCRAGTVKSPFARELARESRRRKLNIDFRSRGLSIEDHVSPSLGAALRADGIDLAREPALPLTAKDLAWADLLVAFDPVPAPSRGKLTLDWGDTPSLNDRYADAKALVERRLGALLSAIAAGCLAERNCA